MKRLFSIVLIVSGLSLANANDDLVIQAGVASDYVFRGISQTDNRPALQGGIEYRHSKGPYAGFWASSIDLPSGSDIETDSYFGYSDEIKSSNIGWDIGYVVYRYNESFDNFEELYGSLSLDVAPTVTFIAKISRDPDNKATVAEAMGVFKLPRNTSFKVRPGLVDRPGSAEDYRFFQLAAGINVSMNSFAKDVDFEISFSDTDIDAQSSRTETIWWVSALAHF
jgi:uncharacterized protein (TIGR02001 family)